VSELLLNHASVLSADGDVFRPNTDILMREGRIVAIGQDLDASHAIDLAGRFVIPGLIDSHYHLVSRSDVEMDTAAVAASMVEGVVNAQDTLSSGVTRVRDCGCRHEGIYALRSAIAEGIVRGPHPYVAGRNPTGGLAPGHWRNIVVDGADQMGRAVHDQYAAGADWVKLILSHADNPFDWSDVTVFLSDDEIAAAVGTAHELGISIGGHCEGWDVAARAVRLGLDSLDHAPLVSDEVAEEMSSRGVFYTPTVWAFSADAGLDEVEATSEQRDAVAAWQAEHRESVRRARRAGVTIVAGSDAADALTGGGVLYKELLALADCGLDGREIVRAATASAAGLQRRSADLGRIAEGYVADLAVFDADPFEDLSTLRNPRLVVQDGAAVFERDRGLLPSPHRTEMATTRRWA
jgi:imidazolonepropionase-like amidohydrolase